MKRKAETTFMGRCVWCKTCRQRTSRRPSVRKPAFVPCHARALSRCRLQPGYRSTDNPQHAFAIEGEVPNDRPLAWRNDVARHRAVDQQDHTRSSMSHAINADDPGSNASELLILRPHPKMIGIGWRPPRRHQQRSHEGRGSRRAVSSLPPMLRKHLLERL